MDDFHVIHSLYGVVAGPTKCATDSAPIDKLMNGLGLKRHPKKGERKGSTVVDHFGVWVDTESMKLTILPHKAKQVCKLAVNLVWQVFLGRRLVNFNALRFFSGTCVLFSLALPWARFHTRSPYWDMSSGKTSDSSERCRLSHQSVRDIKFWQKVSSTEMDGRKMVPTAQKTAMHTDGADVGYEGSPIDRDLPAGVTELWCDHGN